MPVSVERKPVIYRTLICSSVSVHCLPPVHHLKPPHCGAKIALSSAFYVCGTHLSPRGNVSLFCLVR